MPTETDTLIQQEFDKLPFDIKEALSRTDWRSKIREIAKSEKLDEDKTLALETETMFILFGILNADSYLSNIQTEVGLDENTAKQIERKMNEQVFDEVEKQYEMITALMPKSEVVTTPKGHPVAITKPIIDTPPAQVPQPTQALEIPQNKIVEAQNNLPAIGAQVTPIAAELPTAKTEPQATPAPAPVSKPSNLNLIDTARPASDAKPDSAPAKPSDYLPGKDPYRESVE